MDRLTVALVGEPREFDGLMFSFVAVMQTYTTHTDASLTAADLPNLAGRLKLPAGWQFKSRAIDKDLVISTTGLAHIVPDNLENMYQGCIDGACNFDPWQ